MFGYPDLDAGLNTSQFGGDIAFSIRQHRQRLAKPNKDRFRSEPISEFVYICEIDQSHYVI